MNKSINKRLCAVAIPIILLVSVPAHADFWGGDVVVLTQILAQAIQTVTQLQSILSNGSDTLNLLHQVNSGVSIGLKEIQIIDPKFNPGVYGDLNNANDVLQAIQQVYGAIPKGSDHDLIESQDQSVADVIAMNRNLYDYADQVDREKDKIIYQAQGVSPQGAGRLQNQALGILIGVTTQLLRTQSQMLKLMAQNMAFDTRKEKLSTENFQNNYNALSRDLGSLPKDPKLPRIGGDE